MKLLPILLILFSVGIVCIIAETAGAKTWDSFVSDQQIFEAQTIRCDFTQMKTFEETKAYLTQCKIQILDRDGDGVPCEALCD